MASYKEREVWVDNIKAFACILVVLGHFFQSMTKANILPTNNLYEWFNQTIYFFHVPLFFICSGYLYQKLSEVTTVASWKKNVLKKAVALGIPYLTFSLITWALKTVFSGSVNDEIDGLFETLFVAPTSPYWYLYTLFFVCLITRTFRNSRMAICGLGISLLFKLISLIGGGQSVYAISAVLANEVWFVLGMCMCVIDFYAAIRTRKWLDIGIGLAVVFMISSVIVYQNDIDFWGKGFLLGLIACGAVILIVANVFQDNRQHKMLGFLAEYTMPIFLMHTLFAAPFRTVLLKLGIHNEGLHVLLGLAISFVGPIIATNIMKRYKWMEFFLYPGKYLKAR